MRTKHSPKTIGERTERALLRESILLCGRQIGWSRRTAISFTECFSHRPWKRCTSGQLSTVLDDLSAIRTASVAPRAPLLFEAPVGIPHSREVRNHAHQR